MKMRFVFVMFVFFSIFLNIKDLFLFLDPRDIVLYT